MSVADTNYSLGLVAGTITVTQAVLTVSVDDQWRVYGATNPPFTGQVGGIGNEDVITATYSTAAEPASPVGAYEILPGLMGEALTNYFVITNAGTLTVTPAPLGVTADNKSRSYGRVDPPFTGSVVGILHNDAIEVAYTTSAGAASPIGVYEIVPGVSGAALGNYEVSVTNGLLTVTAASLVVKADDQVRPYGRTNAPLSVSYSGFVNGQDTKLLSGSGLAWPSGPGPLWSAGGRTPKPRNRLP